MKILRVFVVIAVIMAALLWATPVFADTSLPDQAPTVESINAYRNLLETGDVLILVFANIPYETVPPDPVTETFIWRLIDTDGTTELGNTVGYAYQDSGYGWNLYSMYFSAADALTWGNLYYVKLYGNPSAFDDPPEYTYQMAADDYSSLTESAAVKAELATRILNISADLEIKWSLSSDYLLTLELGTVLSVYGESFFRGAIFGLQALAPALFRFAVTDLDTADRAWTDDYSANLTTQYTGTWVDTAKAAGGTLFGTSYDLLSIIIVGVLCLGVLIGNIVLTGDAFNGIIDASFIFIICARIGMYGLGYLAVVAAICIIYMGTRIWRIIG